MINLCSTFIAPTIGLHNPPFGNSLPMSYKILISPPSKSDFLNPALWGNRLCTRTKKFALINWALTICVSGLSESLGLTVGS